MNIPSFILYFHGIYINIKINKFSKQFSHNANDAFSVNSLRIYIENTLYEFAVYSKIFSNLCSVCMCIRLRRSYGNCLIQ